MKTITVDYQIQFISTDFPHHGWTNTIGTEKTLEESIHRASNLHNVSEVQILRIETQIEPVFHHKFS